MANHLMGRESKVYGKAYAFAIRVVGLYQGLIKQHQEYVLSKQLLRAGTSIGANIAEANGAISRADFSAKMSIAYKECLEAKIPSTLLKDTDYLLHDEFDSIYLDADEIAKILYSILKTLSGAENFFESHNGQSGGAK